MSQPQPATLPVRDTRAVYGRITRLLHWLIAALMLWQFVGMGLRLIFGRQPLVSFFVGSHQQVGTVLFVLIVLRVIWAVLNRSNRPDHGAGLIGLGARLGHLALYALMLVIASVAILRAYGNTRSFAPFGFEIFPARTEEITWMTNLAGALHGELAWVLAVLILGHIGMVGVHEAMWKDGTLAKMMRRRR